MTTKTSLAKSFLSFPALQIMKKKTRKKEETDRQEGTKGKGKEEGEEKRKIRMINEK